MALKPRLLINTFIFMLITLDTVLTTDIPSADLEDLTNAKLIRNEIDKQIKYLQEFIKNMDDWALEKISKLTKNDRINKNSTEFIEEKYKIFSKNISNLLAELYLVYDLDKVNEIKKRSSIIGTQLDNYFDNATITGLNMFADYTGNTEKDVFVMHSSLLKQMCELHLKIENYEKEIMRSMADHCIYEIYYNENYYKAAEILDKITNAEKQIDYIVQEAVKLPIIVDNVLKFAEEINNITLSFLVYKSLIFQTFWFNNSRNIIIFIQSLNNEIFTESYTPKEIREEAFQVKDTAINYLSREIMNTIDERMFCDNDFPDNLMKLDLFSLKVLFRKIFQGKPYPLDQSLEFEILLTELTQCLVEYRSHNSKNLMKLAHLIKYFSENSYMRTFMPIKTYISLLPATISNLIIPDVVCLKNTRYLTYLTYATNNVTLTLTADTVNVQSWELIATMQPDEFYIKNKDLDKYLTIKTGRSGFKLNKNVYLNEEKITVWKIQLENEHCLISDLRGGEYLYVRKVDGKDLVRVGDNTLQQYWEVSECIPEDPSI